MKGILFADYVRMLRANKDADHARELEPEDLRYLAVRIDPAGWYPMASFERMGNVILREVANGDMGAVRMWGRFSVDTLRAAQPLLVVEGDPIDTLMRFRVLRATYFDFEAIKVPMLFDGQAHVLIDYQMGAVAEEAASVQSMGFFERLLELAGARNVVARFDARSWAGDARTLLALEWDTG